MPGYLIHYAVCGGKSLQNREFVLGVEAPDILKKYYKMYGDAACKKWESICYGTSAPEYAEFALRAQQKETLASTDGLHYGVSSSPNVRLYWQSLSEMKKYRPFYRGYLWHLLTDRLLYAYLDIDSKFEKSLERYNGNDIEEFRKVEVEKLHKDWDMINACIHERYLEIALTPEVEELGVVKYLAKGELTYVDEELVFALIKFMRSFDPLESEMDPIIEEIMRVA